MRCQFVAFLALLLLPVALCSVGCLDENGNAVDWFAAVKFPSGFDYVFVSSNSNSGFGSTVYNLQQTSGPVYQTLEQIYSGSTLAYAMYNDEAPATSTAAASTSYTDGHSKGVVAADANTGFYLLHSVPLFPPSASNGYGIGKNAWTYGQSFLCLSLSTVAVDAIAGMWAFTNPQIYSQNVPGGYQQLYNLSQIATGNMQIVSAAASETMMLSTLGGVNFNYMVKSASWNQDLYEYLVAPYYQTGLIVDTWNHGTGVLNSWCAADGYSYSIRAVADLSLGGNTWYESKDHSKWCVSEASTSANLVCIGDINRVTTQYTRSGGILCTQEASVLFNAFSNMVQNVDGCSSSSSYYAVDVDTQGTADPRANQTVVIVALSIAAGFVVIVAGFVALVIVIRKRRVSSRSALMHMLLE